MLKVIELQATATDSDLIDNIYAINKIIQNMIMQTEFMIDFNYNDYKYISIVIEKCKKALEKASAVMEV